MSLDLDYLIIDSDNEVFELDRYDSFWNEITVNSVVERNEIARIMIDRWIAWAAQPGTTSSSPLKTEQSNSGPTTPSTPKNATD